MTSRGPEGYLMISRWKRISFLRHGFGTAAGKEKDLGKIAQEEGFRILSLQQTHSDVIQIVRSFPDVKLKGDALVTATPRIFLVIRTADCLPALIADESQKVVAAVHCGWRGTCQRVIQKAVQALKSFFDCRPCSLLAALGPAIAGRCYEVGEEVRAGFKVQGLPKEVFSDGAQQEGKYLLDLRRANRLQLLEAGLEEKNIFSTDLCTHCEENLISYRRDRKTKARMLNFIGLAD